MAIKLKPSLSIVANSNTATTDPGLQTDALSFTVSGDITIAPPSIGISRVPSDVNFGDGAGVLIPEENTSISYVYLKHLGLLASNGTGDTENIVEVDSDANSDGFRLSMSAGDFAFFPLLGAEGLRVTAASAAVMMEFGYWTKG